MDTKDLGKLIKLREDDFCMKIPLKKCIKLNPIKNGAACPKCFGIVFGSIPVKQEK